MVVTRKTPVAPAPPASRTSSSQALPRAIKSKNVPQSPQINDKVAIKSKPTIPQKTKPRKRTQSGSYFNRLYLLLLSLFTIYAFTKCRSSSSPLICRSLQLYRTHILDLYIIPPLRTYLVPPIHSAIHHPALEPIHPYVRSIANYEKCALRPRITHLASFSNTKFNQHVLPIYNKYIVDNLWRNRVVPAYNEHVHPHLQPLIVRIVPLYERTSVYATSASTHSHLFYLRTKPYIHTVRVYTVSAYESTKPYAIKGYVGVKPYLVKARERGEVGVRRVLRGVGDVRRMYVDPHVKRVWEKIAERETKTKSMEEPTPVDQPTFVSELSSASSIIVNSAHGDAQSGIISDIVSSASSIAASSMPTVDFYSTSLLAHAQESPTVSSSESVSSTDIPSSTESPSQSESSSRSVSETAPPSTTPTNVEEGEEEEGEGEIDDFLKQLGLEETIASAPSETPSPTSEDSESAKLAEASSTRLAAQASTAAKRDDITFRHDRWQEELDRAVLGGERRVRGMLKGMRDAAVMELGGRYRGKKEGGDGEKKREKGIVGDVEAEARRLVKGLEAYIKKMRGVARNGVGKEEKEVWDRVVKKVEEKFGGEVVRVQREVHEWYVGVREREVGEVQRAAAEVRSLAEKAQADIGFDYAWLEDVTYADWQRYHNLMRTSEQFTAHIQKLQNGTLSESEKQEFPDALVEALDELQQELDDVVKGFAVVLEVMRMKGGRVMSGEEDENGVPAPTPLPVPVLVSGEGEGGEMGGASASVSATGSGVAGAVEAGEGEGEESVSILPIEPQPVHEPGVEEGSGDVEMQDIFFGRSKEEVESRLSSVVEERVREEL